MASDGSDCPHCRRVLLIVTNGNDTNSTISLQNMLDYSRLRLLENNIELLIVGIRESKADFSPLEKLSDQAFGNLYQGPLDRLQKLLALARAQISSLVSPGK